MTTGAKAPQESPEAAKAPAGKPFVAPAPKRKKHWKLGLAALLAVGAVAVIAGNRLWFTHPSTDRLFVSGRIDGYETLIAGKIPGLITYISSREGDNVKAGQVLFRLEDADVVAQLKQSEAAAESARHTAAALSEQISNINQQIAEVESSKQQAVEESGGSIAQAEATQQSLANDVEQAKAQLSEAESQLRLAALTAKRYSYLSAQGAIPQEQADQAKTSEETLAQTVTARKQALASAQQRLQAAAGATQTAQASRLTAAQRQKKIEQLQSQLRQTRLQQQSAFDQVKQSEAKQEELKATLGYLTVTSPVNGVVTARSAEPGAVIASGQTVLTVVDPQTVFLRGFVPDAQIGLVRIGQPAEIFLDSSPDKPVAGHVSEVDPQASFTPENIYFKKDRVKQVFGIKIAVDQPEGYAKLGMPADAEIILDKAAGQ